MSKKPKKIGCINFDDLGFKSPKKCSKRAKNIYFR